jgi:2'-5' RNA ligase
MPSYSLGGNRKQQENNLQEVRAFIAINLADDIIQRLVDQIQIIKDLVPHGAIRWVRKENIHLTLKFLGNVALTDIDTISASMQRLADDHNPFDFEVTSFGCFPNLKSPRTLWIDIREPTGVLQMLQSSLEYVLEGHGFSREQRRFHPHLTIGRVNRRIERSERMALGQNLAEVKVGHIGTVHVCQFELMRSDLRPSGAVYSLLSVASLKE